jgi:hypothetical protein
MPTRSPRNLPTGTIRELAIPERAVTALTRAGVTSIEDLAVLTRRDLVAINGLGPGMIAAIRLVVPEPPTGLARSGASPEADPEDVPEGVPEDVASPARDPETLEEESPAAPEIPSFASLRAPRRRSAVDLLVAGSPPAPSATRPAPAGAPRPAEYADLLRLGGRVIRALVGVPGRVAQEMVREPVRCLRRLVAGR